MAPPWPELGSCKRLVEEEEDGGGAKRGPDPPWAAERRQVLIRWPGRKLACAATLCLAAVATLVARGARPRGLIRGRSPESGLVGLEAACHTALPGEACFEAVIVAKTRDIAWRPELYPGLTAASSFDDFQAALVLQDLGHCTLMPCYAPGDSLPAAAAAAPAEGPAAAPERPCLTAAFGSPCYDRVMWVLRSGIAAHPEWYPTLDLYSGFEDVQLLLERKGEVCNVRPCPAARNPFPRALSGSTNPACNSFIPSQVLGMPDVWLLPEEMQDKCFDDMHAIRRQGDTEEESFVVKEDKNLMRGRNWCWVGFKEFGCHRTWSDHLTWSEMHDLAVKSNVTLPSEFRPIQAPELCDKRDNGATRDWTPEEAARAAEWFDKYVAVYVLSLPTSARRPKVQQRLSGLGIKFAFVDGVDLRKPWAVANAQKEGLIPKTFNFERAQAMAYTEGQNMARAGSIIGTVGTAVAHFKAQRAELSKPPPERAPITLIFEDDICPEHDFILKLWSLVQEELPCDWQAVSLYSRCPFGRCVSPRLTRVQPDINEPMWRCRHGVNWGFQGMLYRTETIEALQAVWQPIVFDEESPNCLYLDNALAAISDRVNFYAVPAAQSPGFLRELDYDGSERIHMNYEATAGNPWKSCTTYGCNQQRRPGDACQCNDECVKHGDCCPDYQAHCLSPGPTLFCFALMRPSGHERELVEKQLSIRAGIFACSATSLFSDRAIVIPGPRPFHTSVVDSNLTCGTAPSEAPLNAQIFAKVWERVFAEGIFAGFDWTVKVDPDTVFLPGRLVEHLRPHEEVYPNGRHDSVYILNCGLGIQGPIEVLSQKAMMRFKHGGLAKCLGDVVPAGNVAAEDQFVDRCWPALGIDRITDLGLLDAKRCGGSASPCLSGKVAFHPFVDVASWELCLWQAQR